MIIKIRGNQSIIRHHFKYSFPNDGFHLALLSFYSTNLIPNVTDKNNKLYLGDAEHSIPTGQYDINSLKSYFFDTFKINLKEDEINNRITIEENKTIDLKKENNICKLLGYSDSTLRCPPKFIPIDTINIHCNLANGQIVSGETFHHQETDIISTFKMNSYFRQPIIYESLRPVYFPVQHNQINFIEIKITDENNDLIDFDGAKITVILEIKSL